MADWSDMIGLNWDDAKAKSAKYNYTLRCYRVDGEGCFVTADYRTDRLNVDMADGKVSNVVGVG